MTSEVLETKRAQIRAAALDTTPVAGLTHQYYKYPARFSPSLAAAAVEAFSSPGDIVLDPFVGGGTTVVEAMARGRATVGSDINSLAVFVTRAKTTLVAPALARQLGVWADSVVPTLSYRTHLEEGHQPCAERTRNMALPPMRPVKKIMALALASMPRDAGQEVELLGRCAILSTARWALDGRRRVPTAAEFRGRLQSTVHEMLRSMNALRGELSEVSGASIQPIVHQVDAAQIAHQQPFSEGCRADLVVTSPPYPGIHVLYHRWQVDGRKETPAPYWVASSRDGEGGSYYTFGDRRRPDSIYFDRLRSTLTGIRAAMREGAYFVQAVAFKDPTSQLAKYLRAMESAGFEEIRRRGTRHIRRSVPGRRWHAFQKGQTPSSQEVVLIHRAR